MEKYHHGVYRIATIGCMLQIAFFLQVSAINDVNYISTVKKPGAFALVENKRATPIYLSGNEYEGVKIAVKNLQSDIQKVSGLLPDLNFTNPSASARVIIIGTVGKNKQIDRLLRARKLDPSYLENKWETYVITTIDNPEKGIEQALVIAGSDMRGTIFGIYDLCEKMGVSPWHFWADVPVRQHDQLYVMPGGHTLGEPKVKYRGIFINDEAPALAGWAEENYGGFTSDFYVHVFELILRLKGNFLWPAMWGRAFYDDDPMNPVLADKFGVIISTSHHEPMMRAHAEWGRYGDGSWNYEINKEKLNEFWREGIKRMGDNESIVTIGMRGDGDEPMSENTAINLLEEIVADQREIIEDVTGEPAEKTPQVWALYKEVQDYYDEGMRVPEDVTLLLCDDNWGNVRMLPQPENRERDGGFGMYYHFDYVGGPRNYKWLNTNQIERVWEQMHLSYKFGVDKIWLVNVGDIKPMEFPISFFLDYAWNPDVWPAQRLPEYYNMWAAQQFGIEYAQEIAAILASYTKYNSRRTPEMLSPETYSLINYQEWERVVNDYNNLVQQATDIGQELPETYQDAFYQLVFFPVAASANLNELYLATARNRLYFKQQRASTNRYALEVKRLFEKDQELTDFYQHKIADGKWNHMMSQTHIGYTYWQQPDKNYMPEVHEVSVNAAPSLGVALENSTVWFPEQSDSLSLPEFDLLNNQTWYIELFNQGANALHFNIQTNVDWIDLPVYHGVLYEDVRLPVGIDWELVPAGKHEGTITVSGTDGSEVEISVPVRNELYPANGFIENNGIIAFEAVQYTKKTETTGMRWVTIPNLGRTSSSVSPMSVKAGGISKVMEDGPVLEYNFSMVEAGEVEVTTYVSPTLNFTKGEGLNFAVSVNDQEPRMVNMHAGDTIPDWQYPQWWNEAVGQNIRRYTTKHTIPKPGNHVLKIWMVDPSVVFQRFVISREEVPETYLGPPESRFME